MKLTHIKKTGLVLVAILAATSLQAYNKTQAETDCANRIAESGKYQFIDPQHVVDKGHHSYKVTGEAESRRSGRKNKFTCSIRHKEVVDWRVTNHSQHSNNHTTGESAFDDMRYLKKQCRQNIRHHISNDQQKVRKIKLDTARLNRRTLKGKGGVVFRDGGGSTIAYECKFDRQGRIYDGNYKFQDYATTPSTKDIIGARGRDGENMLNQRGFVWKRTTKIDNSSYTFWQHRKSKQCIRVQTANGRYRSIVNAPADDCR